MGEDQDSGVRSRKGRFQVSGSRLEGLNEDPGLRSRELERRAWAFCLLLSAFCFLLSADCLVTPALYPPLLSSRLSRTLACSPPDAWHLVPGTPHLKPNTWHPSPALASPTTHQTPGTWNLEPGTWNLLFPTYNLRHTTYRLSPTTN